MFWDGHAVKASLTQQTALQSAASVSHVVRLSCGAGTGSAEMFSTGNVHVL